MKLRDIKQEVFDLASVIDTPAFREMFPELSAVYNLRLKASWLEILSALKAESQEWLDEIWWVTMRVRQRKLDCLKAKFSMATEHAPEAISALVASLPSETGLTAAAYMAASLRKGASTWEYAEADALTRRDRLVTEGENA